MRWRGTALCVGLMIVVALAAFSHVTRGFSAVTSDGVRRVDLEQSPRTLPSLPLVDQDGTVFSLADYGAHSSYTTIVSLVYTHCMTVCTTAASGQAFLQQEIKARGLGARLRLLTLSFDPVRDSPSALSRYADSLGADSALWRMATVVHRRDLAEMLAPFGIVLIPDGLGGYSHNAALFVIDEQGRLSRAYDVDRPDLALADYLHTRKAVR